MFNPKQLEELKSEPVLQRLTVRPHTLSFQQGYSVLATTLDGELDGEEDHGFYERDTRYLYKYLWCINSEPLTPVVVQPLDYNKMQGFYTFKTSDKGYPGQSLHIECIRMIGQGMHEDVLIKNFTPKTGRFTLELYLESDFSDMFEIVSKNKILKADIERKWDEDQQRLILRCLMNGLDLGLIVKFDCPIHAEYHHTFIRWEIELAPHMQFKLCANVEPIFQGEHLQPIYRCLDQDYTNIPRERIRKRWLNQSTHLETCIHMVQEAYDIAKLDLSSMRLWEEDSAEDAWIPAAGLPNYVGVFGRDCLTAGWQAGLYGPEMMRGAILTLNKYQADTFNDWRDEQPGKMIHEARSGPLSLLDKIPQKKYYGSATSTPLYLIVLSELYHWTGDLDFIHKNRPHMDRALDWIEKYGDLDGDGLYEYRTLSSQGLRNQGWKDSDEGIVYRSGEQAEPPIVTCEEQAWVYEAKIRTAIIYSALKEFKIADRLMAEAHELRIKFNDAFWMPDQSYYALALDSEKKQVDSITSNPGHCLVSGIIDEDRASATAHRMLEPDLFSGWGIRTLSSNNPSYNPYSYHLGTVWPVENGTFTMAFVRYGFREEANRLAKAMFEASSFFEYGRLPEAISGYARDRNHPFPSIYPNSCMPQAWSASAIPMMVQAMLGLYPFAPLKLLMLDPNLPDWSPHLKLYHLRVGHADVSLEFWRDGNGKTHHRVLEKKGEIHILPQWVNIHRFHHLKDLSETILTKRRRVIHE